MGKKTLKSLQVKVETKMNKGPNHKCETSGETKMDEAVNSPFENDVTKKIFK